MNDAIKLRSRSLPSFQLLEASNNNDVPRSCHTEYSSGSIKRFHTSHLGRPPGNHDNSCIRLKRPAQVTTKPTIIAPMKQVEKMITDLKKENFDLKLRLFHLQDMMAKDVELYQLKQENYRLRMNLEYSENGKCCHFEN